MSLHEKELSKYSKIWEYPGYSVYSPGVRHLEMFLKIAKPKPGASVLDIGAGSGAASALLKEKGFKVAAFDITNKGWVHPDIPLRLGSVWKRMHTPIYNIGSGAADTRTDFGYCCDMMEHLPEQFSGLAVRNILDTVRECFFSISFLPDTFGDIIGQSLHLTVKPFVWWRDLLREVGNLVDARDMIGEGVFYVR